jgi:tetratricopeptide (TPR) repeat protein
LSIDTGFFHSRPIRHHHASTIPKVTARASVRVFDDPLSRAAIVVLITGVTVLQRFALPFSGGKVSFTLVIGVLAIAVLALRTTAVVVLERLLLYAAMTSITIITLFSKSWFSPPSLLLILVGYVGFVFRLYGTRDDFLGTLMIFRQIMSALAAIGLIQFLIQPVIGVRWMFPFDQLLSENWFLADFNLIIPLYDNASLYKSNGLFFLEPSLFSQFLAIAAIIELLYFHNRIRLVLIVSAMFVSFSGTGLSLLALFGPMAILAKRDWKSLGLGLVGVAVLALFGGYIQVDAFLNRASEFSNPHSSGFARFISPFWILCDYMMQTTGGILFGFGPGSLSQVMHSTGYLAHDPSWFKMMFEYGALGMVAFFIFFLTTLYQRCPDRLLATALLYQFLFLGGYLHAAYINFLILTLVVLHPGRTLHNYFLTRAESSDFLTRADIFWKLMDGKGAMQLMMKKIGIHKPYALTSSLRRLRAKAVAAAPATLPSASAPLHSKPYNYFLTRADHGEFSLTQLDYLVAAGHFRVAADLLPASAADLRGDYLNRYAATLRSYGEEKGDNTALLQAIGICKSALSELARERVPLDWAITQNNLGNALATLGGRESGTAHLEQAVAAYHAALEERTRERVPLAWATTQNNLGNALATLGERESSTARLEQAVAAYHATLLEYTREQVPLDWAMTQNNLGNALATLGGRESGTAHLEQAVAAYHAALEERTRERVPLAWATTQNNLGTALRLLSERESSTARLE